MSEDNFDKMLSGEEPDELAGEERDVDAMSAKSQAFQKKVAFLKEVAMDPDANITSIAKGMGLGRSTAYNYLQEFTKVWVVTEIDKDFPKKILILYNRYLPKDFDKLTKTEVERLQKIVNRIAKRDEYQSGTTINADSLNTDATTTTVMENYGPNRSDPDLGTDELLLRNILSNMRYVQPQNIQRFLNAYSMSKEEWNTRPDLMLEHMKQMFGPGAGQTAFTNFQTLRGKYVADTPKQGNDMMPLIMAMAMGGGGNMAAMLPMLMGGNGGGGGNSATDAIMMSIMSQQSQREQAKKDQQEMMDKAMQVAMLKLVSGSMDDKRPMDPYAYGGQMYVQEVLDENRNVKSRNLIPMSPNMPFNPMMNNQNDLMGIILKNALDEKTKMMEAQMNYNKPITDLFMQMIPNFRSNSNPVEQLGQLRQAFPDLFERKQDQAQPFDLNVYKLKFDTDLAIMAQKVELKKMEHTWRLEELDRTTQQENAKGWMQMLDSFGEKLGGPIAGALIQGMGGGLLSKQNQVPGPQPGQVMRIDPQTGRPIPAGPPGVPPGLARPMNEQGPHQQGPNPLGPMQIPTPANSGPDPATLLVANALDQQKKQFEAMYMQLQNENQNLTRKVTQLSQQRETPTVELQQKMMQPEILAKMPKPLLDQAYAEYMHTKQINESMGSRLEAEMANRELLGGAIPPSDDDIPDEVNVRIPTPTASVTEIDMEDDSTQVQPFDEMGSPGEVDPTGGIVNNIDAYRDVALNDRKRMEEEGEEADDTDI